MKRALIALNLLLATLVLVPCSFAVEAPHPAPSAALATVPHAASTARPAQSTNAAVAPAAAAPEVKRDLPPFLLDSCLPCGETLSDCHQRCVDFGCFKSDYRCFCSGESTCNCSNCVG